MKAYLEYMAEIATENDPVNTILSVAELVRSQAEHSGKVAKLNMVSFLTMLRNAGLNIDKPFLKLTDDDWQKVLQINLTGTFICSQEFALHFGKRRNGHIINFSATTGITGRKNGANYCSSKSGVLTLTKCLAQELSPGIIVNCIVPGHIATEEVISRYKLSNKKTFSQEIQKIPMGRLGRTNDVCNLVDYIINKSTFSTGHKFFVDGGMFMH